MTCGFALHEDGQQRIREGIVLVEARTAKAFNLVLSDENVETILVNIFAGINRCDWIAGGVIQALQKIDLKVPLVVRLAGTNVDEGRKMLEDSGMPIIMADTLEDAANKAVAAWKEATGK